MNNYFSIFGRLFEKDAVTTVCFLVLAVVVATAAWLYRKHTKTDNKPDMLEYDGYYKIAMTPTGYAATDRSNLFRTLTTFYFLRRDPFSIEVTVDNIEARNGKKYRAISNVTVIMPEDRINFVCRRYFDGKRTLNSDSQAMAAIMSNRSNKTDTGSVADILAGKKQNEKISSDEMLMQVLSGQVSTSKGKRNEKTNCDSDIDMDLIIAFSATLKNLITEQAGVLSEAELKKKFLGQAMLEAMTTGHAVMEIPVFNIIEITE